MVKSLNPTGPIFRDPCCLRLPSVHETGGRAASPRHQPSSAEELGWYRWEENQGQKMSLPQNFPFLSCSAWNLSGCLHSCLPGDGLPVLHTSKPLHFYFFLLTLILEKEFICFSEEATIETWTFREWEGNLLKSKEDCRCKMFVMLTPEQTYHCALAYLLPPQCLY